MGMLNLLKKAFEEEIVPDMGLAVLLADEQAKEAFYKAKANVCESEAETLTEWLVDLSSDLRKLAVFANDRVADFLDKYVDQDVLVHAGFYVNPSKKIDYNRCQPCVDILVSERGNDCSLDLRQEDAMPEEVRVYANPKHEVELAGSFSSCCYGESRVRALSVDGLEANDCSLIKVSGGNVVVMGDWAEAYDNSNLTRFTPKTNYLATYMTVGKEFPRFAELSRLFDNGQENQLLQWGKQMQEELDYRFDWGTVRKQHNAFFAASNEDLVIERSLDRRAIVVYARLSEQMLMNEIRWHGMPTDASECMQQLPRKDQLREFIRCYRNNGLSSLRIGDGFLRYNIKTNQMEVVRPNWGGVLASVTYDTRLSMSENIQMIKEAFEQQEVSRGERQSR